MKKITLGVILIALGHSLLAQTVELDVKGSFKSTWLANQNVSDAGSTQDFALGWGYNYGAGATFYFNPTIGIGVDVLLNSHTANYKGDIQPAAVAIGSYTSSATLNTFDIPVLFKLKNKGGGFIELGFSYSTVTSVWFNKNDSYNNGSSASMTADVSQYYAKSGINAVLGLGIKIKMTDRWAIKTGLRFEYGVTDYKGLDAMGRDLSDATIYPTYRPTNPAAGGIMLGVTYTLGNEAN